MFEVFERLRNIKPKDITIGRIFGAILRRIGSVPHRIYYHWPWGFPAKNRERLRKLNGSHKGERCFIVANGPSLKLIDFDLLKNEYTIGMNRIYLMKEENGFMPDCLLCIDKKRLIVPFHEDLDKLSIPCFFPFSMRKYFSKTDNHFFMDCSFTPCINKDATLPFGNGKTVTFNAIQLAYCMGFSEIYIIGKDHNFNTTGKAGKGIEVKGEDENHFIKNYFLPGQKWDLPDFETEEYAYRIARKALEKDGRRIANATIGGKLEIFERVDFYSLFSKHSI